MDQNVLILDVKLPRQRALNLFKKTENSLFMSNRLPTNLSVVPLWKSGLHN